MSTELTAETLIP